MSGKFESKSKNFHSVEFICFAKWRPCYLCFNVLIDSVSNMRCPTSAISPTLLRGLNYDGAMGWLLRELDSVFRKMTVLKCRRTVPGKNTIPRWKWNPQLREFNTCPVNSLCMRPANKKQRYNATSSLIGWTHSQNDPHASMHHTKPHHGHGSIKSATCNPSTNQSWSEGNEW